MTFTITGRQVISLFNEDDCDNVKRSLKALFPEAFRASDFFAVSSAEKDVLFSFIKTVSTVFGIGYNESFSPIRHYAPGEVLGFTNTWDDELGNLTCSFTSVDETHKVISLDTDYLKAFRRVREMAILLNGTKVIE